MTMHKASVLMGLIVMSSLVVVALADGECSKSKHCARDQCCSQFGFCGCGDAYCGSGCIDNCNGCNGRREIAHTMLGEGECSKSKHCARDQCCSQFGFCGCGDAYCGPGCIDNCNGCNGRREIAHTMLGEGECSKSKHCARDQCCSQFGFCGCGDAYCGPGCIDNCNGCNGRREIAHTMLGDGECSKSKHCARDQCCSQFGFCGCGDAYCGSGCIDNCNGCNGRREIAHTMLGEGECSKSNPCKDGECCSKFGFCGCTDDYCGDGCINTCHGCGDRQITSADIGQATYYTTYVPSSCYGFDTSIFPSGNMIAAASTDVFGNRAACGTYYEITCKGSASGGHNPCSKNPTVKVMVVDLCPGCNRNSFDLSREAFSKIADLDAGRITISAKRVSTNHKTDAETITEVV